MSLNDIQLTPQLLEMMYSKSLVGGAEDNNGAIAEILVPEPKTSIQADVRTSGAEKVSPVNTNNFKSLGNNKKNVLIGVNYIDIINLPDPQLDFLTNLLKACQLGLNDVAIINLNNYSEVDYKEVLEYFSSKVVMLFGITPQQFGFPFEIPEYQVQQFAGRTVIHSLALHEIENNKTEKSKLWAGLKRIFGV